MDNNTDVERPQNLALRAAALLPRLRNQREAIQVRTQTLEMACREAATWDHRRAAKLFRDGRCYRIGTALEPQGGLELDDVFLSGFDVLGAHALLLLVVVAGDAPPLASESELKLRLSRTAAGRIIRGWGVWVRWHWLADLYHQEVLAFDASPAARDPNAPWRAKPPKQTQRYLMMELARYLQVAMPEVATRGEAHRWLKDQNGNPRFQETPELPQLPSLADFGA